MPKARAIPGLKAGGAPARWMKGGVELIREVFRLLDEGLPPREVARRTGLSVKYVYSLASARRTVLEKVRPLMLREGLTFNEAARKLGYKPNTIANLRPAAYALGLLAGTRRMNALKKPNREVLELAKNGVRSAVDIGCGRGRNMVFPFSVGVDIDPEVLREAKRRGHVVVADAHHLPFRDGAFDIALLVNVLMFLERPWEALDEALRVAKDIFVKVWPAKTGIWEIREVPFPSQGGNIQGGARAGNRGSGERT